MRTTVTLDPDVEQAVKRAMRERGITFKQAVNDAIRAGEGNGGASGSVSFPTYEMGPARVDVTKALQLAGQLEDEEIARELAQGK